MNRGDYKSVYGTKSIPPDVKCIYEWKFKAKNIPEDGHMAIGIHSFTNYEKVIDEDFSEDPPHEEKVSFYWAITDMGGRFSNHKSIGHGFLKCKWEKEDTIKMIFNTEKNTLSYGSNDNDAGIVFDNIILCYKTYMAMTMGDADISIELL